MIRLLIFPLTLALAGCDRPAVRASPYYLTQHDLVKMAQQSGREPLKMIGVPAKGPFMRTHSADGGPGTTFVAPGLKFRCPATPGRYEADFYADENGGHFFIVYRVAP